MTVREGDAHPDGESTPPKTTDESGAPVDNPSG